MKSNQKITKYPSKNKKTETYKDGNTFITINYYDTQDSNIKEFISLKDETKEIKHTNSKGILSKVEHFVKDKRQGKEIKYFVAKADGSIKSTKLYDNGKLHGENITYNENAQIIKHEVYALGVLVLKYLRKNSHNNEITHTEIISKDNISNLPNVEAEKLQIFIDNNA